MIMHLQIQVSLQQVGFYFILTFIFLKFELHQSLLKFLKDQLYIKHHITISCQYVTNIFHQEET